MARDGSTAAGAGGIKVWWSGEPFKNSLQPTTPGALASARTNIDLQGAEAAGPSLSHRRRRRPTKGLRAAAPQNTLTHSHNRQIYLYTDRVPAPF